MSIAKKDVGVILYKKYASFRVWAPFARSVDVIGTFNDWQKTPLDSEADGYWCTKIEGVRAGQEYKFVIGTGKAELTKNDPRARQVTTSDGNSVVVDNSFTWGDSDFMLLPRQQQVIYELHVGTFNRDDPSTVGNFAGVIDKLDYLTSLGITTIELMPVFSMMMDYGWGYAPDYLYAVESLYGGRAGLMELVNAAHQRGISVVLDVVYNHFGPDKDYDLWRFDGWHKDSGGGIYFYNDWRGHTPWGDTRPDYGRTEVRQFILDNVKLWLNEYHIDGLRIDSTGYMRNTEGNNDDPEHDIPEAWSLLGDINKLAGRIKPDSLMIAEDFSGNDYITKPALDGGAGFDSQWEITFPGVLRDCLDATSDTDRNLNTVASSLTANYNNNAFQRVVYSDSHDSAANGSARLNEQISPGHPDSLYARKRSILAAAIVLTAPGIPMLLQGQEFMQGGSFNDWQELDWRQAERLPGIVLSYSHLIALRKNEYGNTAGLTGQSIAIKHLNNDDKVLAYHRYGNGGPGDDVMIIINFANKSFKDYLVDFPKTGLWRVRYCSDWKGYSPDFKDDITADVLVESSNGLLNLAPYTAVILSQDK
ncbi:MAG: alpha-amylase family glycosyl hydrolase [Candidatus Saccharimonadales bacterium]